VSVEVRQLHPAVNLRVIHLPLVGILIAMKRVAIAISSVEEEAKI